jgi:hypothetical protein
VFLKCGRLHQDTRGNSLPATLKWPAVTVVSAMSSSNMTETEQRSKRGGTVHYLCAGGAVAVTGMESLRVRAAYKPTTPPWHGLHSSFSQAVSEFIRERFAHHEIYQLILEAHMFPSGLAAGVRIKSRLRIAGVTSNSIC